MKILLTALTLACALSANAAPLVAPTTLPDSPAVTPAILPSAMPMPAGVRPIGAPLQTQRVSTPMQTGQTDRCSLRPDRRPHIVRLKSNEVPSVLFQNQADLYGASVPQIQSSADHIRPGDAFELSGACFGDTPGTVEFRWATSPTRDMVSRLAAADRRYTAEITEWHDEEIVGRLPPDISGLAPGTLQLYVRTANGEALSNTISTAFWPVWETSHSETKTRAFIQLAHCVPTSANLRSVCRGGTQSQQTEADFAYPSQGEATRNSLAAAHACRAAQSCKTGNVPLGGTDRYRIEMPAWAVPVITFWREGNTHRKDAFARPALLAENPDVPLSKPRSYLLNVDWSVEEPQETVVYLMDIVIMMPRGLVSAADQHKMRVPMTSPVAPGTHMRMKDLPR